MSKAFAWIRRFVRGKARKILVRAAVILLLVDVGFIFVMPLLRMLSQSLMNVMDFYDPTVVWIPRRWSWENYRLVFLALKYPLSFKNTFLLAAGAAILQTIACAIVGYGFARFNFPGRDKLFLLVLFAMIVPPHVIFIQLFILYKSLPVPAGLVASPNWLDTYLPFYVPEAMGMGLRGALFVFIFRQFFKGMPWELEDAALIDGAGPFRVFFDIMLPPAQPAIVVVFLFSFVWHWNDSLQPSIFLSKADMYVLTQRLAEVEAALSDMRYHAMWGTGAIMTAALLAILPLLLLYLFTQRYFVESIERTGLIG
ncbi:MAG TPA: carbohydrate ABC transporter permease [Anaerolineae bacterium]|nr:carbohydrate ABC transporter permease [Anaerolineae bacterium]